MPALAEDFAVIQGGRPVTYLEQAAHDAELRTFIAAEIARAGIDVRTARVELEHAQAVIADQARRIRELEARTKGKK